LTIWLDQGMPWFAPPSGKRGRIALSQMLPSSLSDHQMSVRLEPDGAFLIDDAEYTQETEALRDLGFIE
jgi:hypothetical protein